MTERCDATFDRDDQGQEGRFTAIVGKEHPDDPGTASVSVGECSEDRYRIWHGMDTPAIACGRHATGGIGNGPSLSVFRGHRNRVSSYNNTTRTETGVSS